MTGIFAFSQHTKSNGKSSKLKFERTYFRSGTKTFFFSQFPNIFLEAASVPAKGRSHSIKFWWVTSSTVVADFKTGLIRLSLPFRCQPFDRRHDIRQKDNQHNDKIPAVSITFALYRQPFYSYNDTQHITQPEVTQREDTQHNEIQHDSIII